MGMETETAAPTPALHPSNVPSAPREPSKRARELVFKYQGAQLVQLLVGTIFLIVGGVLTLVFDARLPAELAIALGGHASTGQVSRAEIERHVRINGVHPTLITFTYEAGGQTRTAQSSTINTQVIAEARPGVEVPIEVAGADPDWARVKGTTVSVLGLWGLFMLLFPSVGLTLVYRARRSNRRQIRAFIHGQPVTARVVFTGPDTSVRLNGRNPQMVRWEFSVAGQLFEGSVSSMKRMLIEPLMQQKELVVLYDPDKPRINTVYVE